MKVSVKKPDIAVGELVVWRRSFGTPDDDRVLAATRDPYERKYGSEPLQAAGIHSLGRMPLARHMKSYALTLKTLDGRPVMHIGITNGSANGHAETPGVFNRGWFTRFS